MSEDAVPKESVGESEEALEEELEETLEEESNENHDGDSEPPVDGEPEAHAKLPRDHPRYRDLVTRHRIEAGVRNGITHLQGMHAEGRGAAFDYLIGERTIESADEAERVAAAHLLLADRPVISVNGNVAALVPDAIVELAAAVDADLEVNLFNRTDERMKAIVDHLREHGAHEVKGLSGDARIPGLSHERGTVDRDGIYAADVVLVPLEDGDRAEALIRMGKTEIVVDLNPLSRSPQAATVPIVDNIVRAVPNITEHARSLRDLPREDLEAIIAEFDADGALREAERTIRTGIGTDGIPNNGTTIDGTATDGTSHDGE